MPLQVFIGLYFVVIDHDLTRTLKTSLTDKYSHDTGNAHQSISFVLEFLLTHSLGVELHAMTLLGQKELKKANELLSEIRNL
ncbi:MAG: hypothetical protein ACFFBD_28175 [Candidatus Hodarchaeota archaeon]